MNRPSPDQSRPQPHVRLTSPRHTEHVKTVILTVVLALGVAAAQTNGTGTVVVPALPPSPSGVEAPIINPATNALPGVPSPRIGRTPGATRVVFDLPPGVVPAVTPLPRGVQVEFPGAASVDALDSVPPGPISPELTSWQFGPSPAGVPGATLLTAYPVTSRGGWNAQLLPAADGSPGQRLVLDFSPGLADTTQVSDEDRPLLVFPPGITVILDPGHGGIDPGASGSVTEKAVALDVALRVKALLEAAGVQVVLTRDHDTQLSLDKATDLNLRALLAVLPARLFLSIHVNAADSAHALSGYGTETWWTPNDPGSQALAQAVQASVVGWAANVSRGLKSDHPLAVLKGAHVPAALVEMGFLSHPVEGLNLRRDAYLDRIAEGVAWGVRNFVVPLEAQVGPKPAVGGAPGRP